MAVLGVSSVTPAFPKIIRELNISPQDVGLLITVFTLPGLFLTAVMGILADRFGRKKIMLPSLFLFAIAGTACGFARDFHLLLVLRFFQGVGAASIGSLNVTLIGDLYSGKERPQAMGYNASVLSVGTASYPAIGGTLAMFGWHYPFFLPIFAIPIGLWAMFFLNNPEPKKEQDIRDYLQNVWLSVKSRKILGLFLTSVMTFILLYGAFLTYFPILMDNSFGTSALLIGLIMSSMSVANAVTSAQLGKLTNYFSEKALIKIGYVFYAVALLVFPLIPKLGLFLIPTIIFGVGNGINIPSILSFLSSLAPMKYRGAFMSLNGMVLRLGQTLGPLVMGAIYGLWGVDATFYVGAALAILMIGIVIILIR